MKKTPTKIFQKEKYIPQDADSYVCSVCGKKIDEPTDQIINGGYACSWKCFLNFIEEKRKNFQVPIDK